MWNYSSFLHLFMDIHFLQVESFTARRLASHCLLVVSDPGRVLDPHALEAVPLFHKHHIIKIMCSSLAWQLACTVQSDYIPCKCFLAHLLMAVLRVGTGVSCLRSKHCSRCSRMSSCLGLSLVTSLL